MDFAASCASTGSERGETRERGETFDGSNFDASPFRPGFVENSIYNKCETLEKKSKSGKRQER